VTTFLPLFIKKWPFLPISIDDVTFVNNQQQILWMVFVNHGLQLLTLFSKLNIMNVKVFWDVTTLTGRVVAR
jgi:hypothetical protein